MSWLEGQLNHSLDVLIAEGQLYEEPDVRVMTPDLYEEEVLKDPTLAARCEAGRSAAAIRVAQHKER